MSDPRHTDDADEALMAFLMEWRQRLIDSGAVAPTSLKEVHIRQIARHAPTDVDQIRAMLPGSVAEHAEDLARVIRAHLADSERGGNRTGTTDVGQPLPTPTPAPPPTPPPTRPAADNQTTTAMPVPSPAPPNRSAGPSLSATDFAPFTFTTEGGREVHPVSRRGLPGGQNDHGPIEFSWPPYLPGAGTAESVVLYRLVSGDENPPIAPDRAHLVVATTTTSARDDRPIDAAVRHYQVWVNCGGARAAALAAQPVKHASGVEVGRVRDLTLREDGGQVIGQWRVAPLIKKVYVYRVPAEHQGRVGPEFRICTESDNLTGFRDAGVERGRRYRYVVRAAAAVDGSLRPSDNTVERVLEISVILAPVADLAMVPLGGPMFDVTWTPPPGGEVAVFRTPNAPSAGTDANELPESALEQIGLRSDFRLSQPVDEQGAGALMSSVVWPEGWNRVCLTPVTLLNGRALLGRTVSSVRTDVIRDVDLAEYCNKQVLTFTWPEGAHFVVVYPAHRGYDPRNGLTGRSFEIAEEAYARKGGLQFAPGELPYRGCSLHLQPVVHSAGRRMGGEIRSIEYLGLVRLWYDIKISRDPETRQPIHAAISMWAQEDIPSPPSFVLVNNPDRIPLSRNDGAAVDVAPLDAQARLAGEVSKTLQWAALTTHPTGELWAANLRGKQGWIRLFANTPSAERLRTIALLDPPVEQLRLTSAAIR